MPRCINWIQMYEADQNGSVPPQPFIPPSLRVYVFVMVIRQRLLWHPAEVHLSIFVKFPFVFQVRLSAT